MKRSEIFCAVAIPRFIPSRIYVCKKYLYIYICIYIYFHGEVYSSEPLCKQCATNRAQPPHMCVYAFVAQLWAAVKFGAAFRTRKTQIVNVGREGRLVGGIGRPPRIVGEAGRGSLRFFVEASFGL